MSDIFISYTREDQDYAQTLADALAQEGYSVWWDPKIPPGKQFDEVIQNALAKAKCVVVLWSKKSVLSDWVKEEAEEGKKRQILVPVLIEDATIPLGFRRIQTADLRDWKKGKRHSDYQNLKNAISTIVDSAASTPEGKHEPALFPWWESKQETTLPAPVLECEEVVKFLPQYVKLRWNAVPGATSYKVVVTGSGSKDPDPNERVIIYEGKETSCIIKKFDLNWASRSPVWAFCYVQARGAIGVSKDSPWSEPYRVDLFKLSLIN
jgi:hypothetical protein